MTREATLVQSLSNEYFLILKLLDLAEVARQSGDVATERTHATRAASLACSALRRITHDPELQQDLESARPRRARIDALNAREISAFIEAELKVLAQMGVDLEVARLLTAELAAVLGGPPKGQITVKELLKVTERLAVLTCNTVARYEQKPAKKHTSQRSVRAIRGAARAAGAVVILIVDIWAVEDSNIRELSVATALEVGNQIAGLINFEPKG